MHTNVLRDLSGNSFHVKINSNNNDQFEKNGKPNQHRSLLTDVAIFVADVWHFTDFFLSLPSLENDFFSLCLPVEM